MIQIAVLMEHIGFQTKRNVEIYSINFNPHFIISVYSQKWNSIVSIDKLVILFMIVSSVMTQFAIFSILFLFLVKNKYVFYLM